jgi:hypothetical protein
MAADLAAMATIERLTNAVFVPQARYHTQESALSYLHHQRPDMPALLEDETSMPRLLDVFTRLSTAWPDDWVTQDLAFRARYSAAQMVSINGARMREIAAEDSVLGDQALALLFDSAVHMSPLDGELGYLTSNIGRAARLDVARGLPAQLQGDKYSSLALVLLDHKNREIDRAVDVIDDLIADEGTHGIGLTMQGQAIKTYLGKAPAFEEGVTGNGQISFSDYLKFNVKIQNSLRRASVYKNWDADEELTELLQEAETLGLTDNLWTAALDYISQPYSLSWLSEELARRTLAGFNIDYAELKDAWMVGGESRVGMRYSFDEYMRDNLRVVRYLEKAERGSVKILMQKDGYCFGLRNFCRYPREMLLEQYRQRDNKKIPYGAVIYSLDDHNTALEGTHLKEPLRNLNQQLQAMRPNVHLRFYECDSGTAVMRALLQARYRYERQLSFVLGIAHGNQNGMSFKDAQKNRRGITKADVARARQSRAGRFNRYGSLFLPDATGAANSCSTGTRLGIGDELADFLRIKVIAQTVPTQLQHIGAIAQVGGGVDLSTTYWDGQARVCGTAWQWN